MADKKRKFDESKVKRDKSGRFSSKAGGNNKKNRVRGASIPYIPGESPEATRRRAKKAAEKLRKSQPKGINRKITGYGHS